MKHSPFRIQLGLLSLAFISVGWSDSSVRVKDIAVDFNSSHPTNFARCGDYTYFAALTPANGRELWRTDGTSAGTTLVKDLAPGSSHAFGSDNDGYRFGVMGGNLYFRTSADSRFWRSDGTDAGTIQLNPDGVLNSISTKTFTLGNTVYFSGYSFAAGTELWKTDGTVAGTVMAGDFNGGPDSSLPAQLVVAGNSLYFKTSVSPSLYRVDGSSGAIVPVAPISGFSQGVAMGSQLYFVGNDGSHGSELMKTDGTAAGTSVVKDLVPGAGSAEVLQLTKVGSLVYFVSGSGLWKSDGTSDGTVKVKTLDTNSFSITGLTGAGDLLFFLSGTSALGQELWKSDGTEAGTVMVKDIDSRSGRSSGVSLITPAGNRVYFTATDPVNGTSLWKSDGTEAGTVRIDGPSPENLYFDGKTIYFSGFGALDATGWELYKYDVPSSELPVASEPLSEWLTAHFGTTVNAGDSADDADPDADGMSNILEFLTGSDPVTVTADVSATGTIHPGKPVILPLSGTVAAHALFSRRTGAPFAGFSLVPEFSTDLSGWQPVTTSTQVAAEDGMEILSVEIPAGMESSALIFFHLKLVPGS